MKLTESKLRNIIREELSRLTEAGGASMVDPAKEHTTKETMAIESYLADQGLRLGYQNYEYKGLYFNVDPMGGMATFINVFRDKNDSESVVSAKIEGGNVTFQEPVGPGMKPKQDTVRYTGPDQVIDALVERAIGGQTAYR